MSNPRTTLIRVLAVAVATMIAASGVSGEGVGSHQRRTCLGTPLLTVRPTINPVVFALQGVDVVISLDDCLEILRDPRAYAGGVTLSPAFKYFAQVRDAFPQSYTFEPSATVVADADRMLFLAFEKGIAYCADHESGATIPELTRCTVDDTGPCSGRPKYLCGCVWHTYGLADGRVLATGDGECA